MSSIPVYGAPSCNPVPQPCQNTFNPPSNDPLAGVTANGIRNQIFHLNLMIGNFIQRCDSVSRELESARSTEFLDMNTSNANWGGSMISNLSYHQNHAVAGHVDDLQREAVKINQMVLSSGLTPAGMPLHHLLLNTDLNGNGIRRAENAEHDFSLLDYFTNGSISSYGSIKTAGQLMDAKYKVEQLRWQAQSLQSSLSIIGPQYPNANPFQRPIG